MKFSFKATRTSGEVFEGIAEAADKFNLARQMRSEGKTLLSASPVSEKTHGLLQFFNGILAHVSTKEKIFFANNLSEMVSAGLTLSRALSVLARQTKNKALKNVTKTLLSTVDQGGSFASGLALFPKVFSHIFVAMVEAGEKSGRLPESLKIVSDQMSKSYSLKKKVRGALIYPAIIIIAMFGIGILMLVYVVPTLSQTFKELGADLPFTTRLLIGTSDFVVAHLIAMAIILVAAIVGLVLFFKASVGKRTLAFVFLHLPIFGPIVKEYNSAVTSRTISSLVSSGVDIVEALTITERVLQNAYYKEVLLRAAADIPKGKNLSLVFQEAENLYPPFVGEMVEVGEETGKMSELLLKLAVFYEAEIDNTTKDLSTVIEPVVMLLIGGAVGFFALSIIQPIYSLSNSI